MGYWKGEWPNQRYIETCKWCGKEFSGYGGGNGYCGEECRLKAKEASRPKREPKANSSTSYDDDDHGTSLFGFIWKVAKWVIIFFIVWFVYDNYIKGDSSKTSEVKNVSSNTSIEKNEAKANASSKENTIKYSNSKQHVVIDGSQLRLRLGPSTEAETFKWKDGTNRHPKVGEKFEYLGESGEFYRIDFHGHQLWVSKQYTHLE